MNPSRRLFFSQLAAALAVIALPACGSSDDAAATAPGDCGANGAKGGTISGNHGHTLTVSAADVAAGAQKDYDIQGSGDHAHSITLTAAHFTDLKDGKSVTITSTNVGHTHSVTVVCA